MIWVFPKPHELSTWDEYEIYPRIENTSLGQILVIWRKLGVVDLARYVEEYQASHSADRRIKIDYINSQAQRNKLIEYLSTHEFVDEGKTYRYPPSRGRYHFIQDTERENNLSSNRNGGTEGRPYEPDPNGEAIINYMRIFSEREGKWPTVPEIKRDIDDLSPYFVEITLKRLESAGYVNIKMRAAKSNARICELLEV